MKAKLGNLYKRIQKYDRKTIVKKVTQLRSKFTRNQVTAIGIIVLVILFLINMLLTAYPKDLYQLMKISIDKNTVAVCNNVKGLRNNTHNLTLDQVKRACQDNFNKAYDDKFTREALMTKVEDLAKNVEYKFPQVWRLKVEGNCISFRKAFEYEFDSKFSFFNSCKVDINVDATELEEYVKKANINSKPRVFTAEDTVINVYGDFKPTARIIYLKKGVLFDAKYTYHSGYSSKYDEERIIKFIKAVKFN